MNLKEIIIEELKKWNLGVCEYLEGSQYTRFQFLSEKDTDDIAEEIFGAIKRNLSNKAN